MVGFLIVFSFIVFFAPEGGGYFLEFNNFIPADPLKTRRTSRRSGTSPVLLDPACRHLPAVRYRREVLGRRAMGAAVVIIAFLPWLTAAR